MHCLYYHSASHTVPGHCTNAPIGWSPCRAAARSWGTYWGELGFFKLQRGVNSLQLEAGDCWYAIPTWQDERDVRAGVKVSITQPSAQQHRSRGCDRQYTLCVLRQYTLPAHS